MSTFCCINFSVAFTFTIYYERKSMKLQSIIMQRKSSGLEYVPAAFLSAGAA